MQSLKIRRVLLSVSDKSGVVELGRALHKAGAELVATGKTASTLAEAGLPVTPVEKLSGSPEAFQGRMKTLSFPIFSGILFRRGSSAEAKKDQEDLERLGLQPIDCVVVNFYPFEAASAKAGVKRSELIEEIDIGGPSLVRAAAKNSPDVLVLTSPAQYGRVVEQLNAKGAVDTKVVEACSARAWELVRSYDTAIARELGDFGKRKLRYGENPHQKGFLEYDAEGPIDWGDTLSPIDLSYNNILDLSAAYALASDLQQLNPQSTSVVIVKHGNPCGVASVPKNTIGAQRVALARAWEGDPVSAFGGVVVFTDPIEEEVAVRLSERFIDLVGAPALSKDNPSLKILLDKRKNLKAVPIRRFGEMPAESMVLVPGGRLYQTTDFGFSEHFDCVTNTAWPEEKKALARFGVAVVKALKSNAIALVREAPGVAGAFQLIGAGQGQPNRIEALKSLAIPRAQSVLRAAGGSLADCVLVSDAFFPFRDGIDTAHSSGIKYVIQPGGSIRDAESIAACDEFGIAMVFTGTRHFRH